LLTYLAVEITERAARPSARMAGMNAHLSPQQRAQLFVRARVSTRHSRISGLPESQWPRQSGVIIEDYSDLLEDTAHTYGRDWAITRRYAIALDDGSLIFRDTNNLDPDPTPSSPNGR